MIFEFHKSLSGETVMVFESSDECWEAYDMIEETFKNNSQRQMYICCFNQYENGIIWHYRQH